MTSKHALFMGWNRPITGRETIAVELFTSTINYLTKLQKNGDIEGFDPVLLHPHGGDLNGFFYIRGDRDKINKIRHADEWLNLTTDINLNVMGFGITDGWIGDNLTDMMTRYQKAITK